MPLTRSSPLRPLFRALLFGGLCTGCNLQVANPNAPDRELLFTNPAAIQKALTGAFHAWINTRQAGQPALTLATMADSYSAGWNDYAIRFYSSEPRAAWVNDPTLPGRSAVIESGWYGNYAVLSTANDLLQAFRQNGILLDPKGSPPTLIQRATMAAVMLQGVALAGIALNYDSGFVASEDTPPEAYGTLPVLSRAQLRDTALARFEAAIPLAQASTLSTPEEWTGSSNGIAYASAQVIQLIRTMQAELLAHFPRNGAENNQADWARIASYAAQGISAAPAFDFRFNSDELHPGPFDLVKAWGNNFAVRVDTRVAHLLAPNQQHPWPSPGGNPRPVSADRRLGDGSWGPADDYLDLRGFAATPDAGTDFAWFGTGNPGWPAGRGIYHNSNIGRIRYFDLPCFLDGCPSLIVPLYSTAFNDLLWAEGLIRSGGNPTLAAGLIDNTRVTRGGLPPLTGSESTSQLLAALQYEQEIELMDLGATVFYNRRRIDGLQPFTPRQMPMPYKELDRLRRELYSYGGANGPDLSAPASNGAAGPAGRIPNVRDIYREIEAQWRRDMRRRS